MPDVEIPDPNEVKEKAENPFTRQIALFVAVYAVGLAISAFGGSNAAKEMMLAKQDESNRWSQYQSKATREALYRNEIKKLEADRKDAGGKLPSARQELLDWYVAEEKRMKTDKKAIMSGGPDDDGVQQRGALEYQTEVKTLQRKDPYFDFAEVAFQIAIVLASVAMLAEKKWAFYTSLGLALAGTLLAVNGFGLFVSVPGLD